MKTPFAAYRGNDPFVFVCYSHRDARLVYPEITWLHEQGERVWYDEGISAGRNWRGEIGNAISRARTFIFYISANSLASDHCSREINYALDEGIEILPIFLEDVELTPDLRLGLGRVQALMRFEDPRYEDHLLAALNTAEERTPVTPHPSHRTRRRRRGVGLAIATGLAIAVIAWWRFTPINGEADLSNAEQAPPADSNAVMTVGITPFAPQGGAIEGLDFEVERRLSASEDMLVRVSGQPGEREDYRLAATVLADLLRLQLRDRNEVLMADWTVSVDEDLDAVANSIARTLLLKLGRRDDVLGQFETDIDPKLFRIYLTASATLRQSHSLEALTAAEAGFNQVVEAEPQYAPAHAGLCNTLLYRYESLRVEQDFLSAERHCHRALTLSQEDYAVHIALGSLYRETGQFGKALDELHRATALAPWSTDAMRGLAQALDAAGSDEEALGWYREAIRVEPSHWENYHALGLHHFIGGDFSAAAQSFESALALAPNEAATRNNLAGAYFMLGNHDAAVIQWERVAETTADAMVFGNLAATYFYQGQFDRALDRYREAEALAPDDYLFTGHIAEVLNITDPPAAQPFFERAIARAKLQLQVNPKDTRVLADIASYRAGLGQSEETLALIAQTRALLPWEDPIAVLYSTAIAYMRMGDQDAARASIEELTALGYEADLLEIDANFAALYAP